jgi:hypothetical protein
VALLLAFLVASRHKHTPISRRCRAICKGSKQKDGSISWDADMIDRKKPIEAMTHNPTEAELAMSVACSMCCPDGCAYIVDGREPQCDAMTGGDYLTMRAASIIRTIKSALPGLSELIAGTHVVVPREATGAMLESADNVLCGVAVGDLAHDIAGDVYAAMVEEGMVK